MIDSNNLPKYVRYISTVHRGGSLYAKLSISNDVIKFHWTHTIIIGSSSWDNFNRMIDTKQVSPMSKEEYIALQIIEA